MKSKGSSDDRRLHHHTRRLMRQQAVKAGREGQAAVSIEGPFGVNIRTI